MAGMSDFSSGYKRLVADKKLNGEMEVQEGKCPITFAGYIFVAQKALKMTADFHLSMFAHLFLLLCWNLMARSVSVCTIMLQHISWEQDSMVVTTPKHKGDQEGNNCYPKHVFANTDNPTICPILSMAILFFGGGWQRIGAKHLLFRGTATEGRFSKWLKGIMRTSVESMITMGTVAFDIGTHSFRKGVATFVAGSVGGPSPISIFLRAGWSLGIVTSRYIFTGQGGDQFVGRAATGLPLTDRAFASLPPHFLPDEPLLTDAIWRDILPEYDGLPASFKAALPYLLASLVYHKTFLISTLCSDHPIFLSRVWTTGIMNDLSSKVLAGCGRNPISNMAATGIPPTLVLANQMDMLSEKVTRLEDNF